MGVRSFMFVCGVRSFLFVFCLFLWCVLFVFVCLWKGDGFGGMRWSFAEQCGIFVFEYVCRPSVYACVHEKDPILFIIMI